MGIHLYSRADAAWLGADLTPVPSRAHAHAWSAAAALALLAPGADRVAVPAHVAYPDASAVGTARRLPDVLRLARTGRAWDDADARTADAHDRWERRVGGDL